MVPRPVLALVLAAALTLPLATPRQSHAAWPHNPGVNLPVCTAAGNQQISTIVPDGAGGAIVAWEDSRSGNRDIYAQHVLPEGAVDPAWPANGRALCTAANTQQNPKISTDGAGGAIVTWQDYRAGASWDIYAQHVMSMGVVDPAWPADGRALCTAPFDQEYPTIVADGAGGAMVTWQDPRGGAGYDIYVQHVMSTGVVDPGWPANGRALCTATSDQVNPTIAADGGGGAIVAWGDYRSFAFYDIYAQHVMSTGVVDAAWPSDGRALSYGAGDQAAPQVVADGAGGGIVSWADYFDIGTSNSIWAQHVKSTGAVDPAWPANGRVLCTAAGMRTEPRIAADGSGGAIVTWGDARSGTSSDVYAHHVMSTGALDPAWPANGRALCTAAGSQSFATIAADGSGGAIVTWQDARSGTPSDVYAHHVMSTGTLDPAWPADGRALCTAAGSQTAPMIVPDGAGGAVATWCDSRSGTGNDIYAQRVGRFGRLGNPEPEIADVRDVPNDQGGRVRVTWRASYLDTLPTLEVSLYGIWHRVTEAAALAATKRGTPMLTVQDLHGAVLQGTLVQTRHGLRTIYWEGMGTVAARGDSVYTFLAMTLQDSAGASNPYSVFMVDAHGAFLQGFWESAADSGYSVDNLAPATPAPFTGNYSAGATHLHWNPNHEPDLAHYRLYRGNSAGFVPGPSNLIGSPPDTGYADVGGAGSHYKLSAVDVHGNEGGFALLTPASTSDVEGTAPSVAGLAQPRPNPAVDAALLGYALPREARVRLAIFDLAGRRVRTLKDERMPAGEHAARWDLRSEAGVAVANGLYFARLEAEGRTFTRRLAIAR